MTSVRRPSEALAVAREDVESVVDLTGRLVKLPSRGGIDDYAPVLGLLAGWLGDHGLDAVELRDDVAGRVGLFCEVRGRRSGPCWVLNACVDTAPFGDERAWTHGPTDPVVEDGWLWGRGCADSKVGAAIFCHIARRVAGVAGELDGDLVVLLDADEHTGSFGGARAFFESVRDPRSVGGVMIGYPGIDELVVGSRGVVRVEAAVRGVAGHSGSRSSGRNAIEKAAELIGALARLPLPETATSAFPIGPRVSVTAVHGGEGYTITPDLCSVSVDARTTPAVGAGEVLDLIQAAVVSVDDRWEDTPATETAVVLEWPPYVLAEDAPLRTAVLRAAHGLGLDVVSKVSGPSNIGNYLATLGVPATAGFGVSYRGLHAVDERIELSTIPTVQAAYHSAVLELLR